jgi:hypothetical protein
MSSGQSYGLETVRVYGNVKWPPYAPAMLRRLMATWPAHKEAAYMPQFAQAPVYVSSVVVRLINGINCEVTKTTSGYLCHCNGNQLLLPEQSRSIKAFVDLSIPYLDTMTRSRISALIRAMT